MEKTPLEIKSYSIIPVPEKNKKKMERHWIGRVPYLSIIYLRKR